MSCVATGVPYVATWFSGCRQLLGRNIVFSCRDSACFSVVTMSQRRFSCRSRDSHDKLHPSCCNMFGLGRDFSVATEFGQGYELLCRDRVWPWARILCCDKVFLCHDRVWSRLRVFMSQQNIFMSRQSWPR